MKRIIYMLTLMFLFQPQSFATTLTAAGGDVKFTAVGKPGFLKIRGESKGTSPTGNLKLENEQVTGEFHFDLKSLDTGIELRNEHMKDKYLEVGKYPQAVLTLDPIPVKGGNLGSDMQSDFSGKLNLHGVTQNVKGKFQYTAKDKKANASFAIKVSDYKIDVPKYMGVTVSETVDVEASVALK